jgi:hypothetical protein
MSEVFGPFREGSLTDDEIAHADALVTRRYANPIWTHGHQCRDRPDSSCSNPPRAVKG